ncbi:MAG: TetR/AcrR family transcriptional regulator [Ilumatobacteraceae bacterium]
MTDPCALQELAVRRVPTQVRSRQRYDEICEAALQLLRSGGVAACTMAAVAAEAQLKPTSLYRYFPNIESLLYAVVSMQLDEVHEWLQGHMAASTSLADAERLASEALERYERRFRAEPAMMAIWAGTLAMPSLVQLNVADTRRNARVSSAANAVRRTPAVQQGADEHSRHPRDRPPDAAGGRGRSRRDPTRAVFVGARDVPRGLSGRRTVGFRHGDRPRLAHPDLVHRRVECRARVRRPGARVGDR